MCLLLGVDINKDPNRFLVDIDESGEEEGRRNIGGGGRTERRGR